MNIFESVKKVVLYMLLSFYVETDSQYKTR